MLSQVLAAVEPVVPNIPTSLELSGRIVLAAALGGLIGLERELSDHPSGLRTHIAVAIGAALFGVTSAYAFSEFVALRNDNNYQLDPTRIASQVVVGVGFLGGGAIIKSGNTVRGLTSAAGLWVSAAVGLAVALGMWIEASVTTVTLLLALVMLKRPRRWIRRKMTVARESLIVGLKRETDDPSSVISALGQMEETTIHSLVVRQHPDEGITVIACEIEVRGGRLEEHLETIENHPDVESVEFN